MRKPLAVLSLFLLFSVWAPSVFAFEMERPSESINLKLRDNGVNTDDYASVGVTVYIQQYEENTDETMLPFNGSDGLRMALVASANTRKGVVYAYDLINSLDGEWIEAPTQTGITEDNGGKWLGLPFNVRFYGGPNEDVNSGEYPRLWVSSNGFLSFDNNSNSSIPKSIPNSEHPNTLLAAYWSDLDPAGGSIKYYNSSELFVVEWENVLNRRNNKRQTFEVVIERYLSGGARGQNGIKFLYKDVTWSSDAVAGIEDQEGWKGTVLPHSQSGKGLRVRPDREAPKIKRIIVEIRKSDVNASIVIASDGIVGRNMVTVAGVNPNPDLTAKAISGFGGLLITTLAEASLVYMFGGVVSLGGILWAVAPSFAIGAVLVTADLAAEYVQSFSPLRQEATQMNRFAGPNDNAAFVNASAYATIENLWPVEAHVGLQFCWIFGDHNVLDHSLTVSAKVVYDVSSPSGVETITSEPASVNLSIFRDAGNNREGAKLMQVPAQIQAHIKHYGDPADFFKFEVTGNYPQTITAVMQPANESDFDLELWDSTGTQPLKDSRNEGIAKPETIEHDFTPDPGGTTAWYISVVYRDDESGNYTLWVDVKPLINGPMTEHLTLKTIVGPYSQRAALINNEIDVLTDLTRKVDIDNIQVAGDKITSTPSHEMSYFAFNLRKPYFGPQAGGPPGDSLRKAIAHLLPKDNLISTLFGYIAVRLDTFAPPSIGDYYEPDVTKYEYSPKAAYDTLIAGGWKYDNNYGTWKYDREYAGGSDKTIQIMSPLIEVAPHSFTIALRLVEEMNALKNPYTGAATPIKTAHSPMNHWMLIEQVFGQHNFEMYFGEWDANTVGNHPDFLYRFFHSGNDIEWGDNSPGLHNNALISN